jgi:hypothetical protein
MWHQSLTTVSETMDRGKTDSSRRFSTKDRIPVAGGTALSVQRLEWGWLTRNCVSIPVASTIHFLCSTTSWKAIRLIQLSVRWLPAAPSLGVKRPGREGDCSHFYLLQGFTTCASVLGSSICFHGVVRNREGRQIHFTANFHRPLKLPGVIHETIIALRELAWFMILNHQNSLGGYEGAHRKTDHQCHDRCSKQNFIRDCSSIHCNLLYHCHIWRVSATAAGWYQN